MPQGQKRKSAEEILGIRPARKSAEEILGARPAPQPEASFWENLQAGAAQGLNDYILSPALSLAEAVGSATTGDFRPLGEMAELAGRGLLKTASAFDPVNAEETFKAVSSEQDPEIQKIHRQQFTRRQKEGSILADLQLAREESEREASNNPSFSNKAARFIGSGAVGAVPLVAAGMAGGLPAVTATTAMQSASQPENLALNVGASVVPIPVGKAVAPLLRRIRGSKAPTPVSKAIIPEEAAIRAEAGLPELETITATSTPSGVSMRATGPRANFESDLEAATQGFDLFTRTERTPVLETIAALRKAGLLTGAKTHFKNVMGTGAFQLSEEASRIPAVVVDMVMSLKTGRRTITGPSLEAMGRSAREAATKGWKEAKEIIRQGISEDDLARLQLPQEIRSGNKVLDTYVNTVFRTLNAEDRILRTYAFRRSLEDRARATALTEMKQKAIGPKDVMKRADEIVANPDEALVAEALADAEIAVFTNENLVSGALGQARDFLRTTTLPGGKTADFAVDMIVPFTKTPTNVIARMLDYTPVGLVKANTFKAARAIATGAEISPEMQRQFAQTFGRAGIGSGLIALGSYLYNKGLMTGLIEDDPQRRARDEAAGRIPGALLVGDTWHQLVGFAPLGSLLAIGATLARETEQEGEDAGMLPTLEIMGQAVGEQPLLIGSKQIGEALAKPGSVGEKLLGGLAGSFVPTIASDVAEAIDSTQRETRGAGITGQFQKRVPGLRQTLPEAVDVLGQPRQDYGPGQAMLDPTRATTDAAQSNPLFAELVRLDAGISGFRQKAGEAPDGYRRKVQAFGALYSRYGLMLIDSPQYRGANDEDRKEAIKSLNSRSKDLVDDGKEGEAPARLSPATLFEAIRQRKEKR